MKEDPRMEEFLANVDTWIPDPNDVEESYKILRGAVAYVTSFPNDSDGYETKYEAAWRLAAKLIACRDDLRLTYLVKPLCDEKHCPKTGTGMMKSFKPVVQYLKHCVVEHTRKISTLESGWRKESLTEVLAFVNRGTNERIEAQIGDRPDLAWKEIFRKAGIG